MYLKQHVDLFLLPPGPSVYSTILVSVRVILQYISLLHSTYFLCIRLGWRVAIVQEKLFLPVQHSSKNTEVRTVMQ